MGGKLTGRCCDTACRDVPAAAEELDAKVLARSATRGGAPSASQQRLAGYGSGHDSDEEPTARADDADTSSAVPSAPGQASAASQVLLETPAGPSSGADADTVEYDEDDVEGSAPSEGCASNHVNTPQPLDAPGQQQELRRDLFK